MKVVRLLKPQDGRLALGFGLTGAACVVIPLMVGLLTGHATSGAVVGLGAWLVTGRAVVNPAAVRLPYLLGVVVSIGVGTALGILVAGQNWLMVLSAAAVAGLSGLIPSIGVTPTLTLLLTAANPLPLDPLAHTALQMLGGLLASMILTLPWWWRQTRPLVTVLSDLADALAELAEAVAQPDLAADEWDVLRRRAAAALVDADRRARARSRRQRRSQVVDDVVATLRRVFHEVVALHGLCGSLNRQAGRVGDKVGMRELAAAVACALRTFMTPSDVVRRSCRAREAVSGFAVRVHDLRAGSAGSEHDTLVLVILRQIVHAAERIDQALAGSAVSARMACAPGLFLPAIADLAVPPTAELRSRLGFDNPRVRHALRVVLGTAFATLIIVLYRPPFPQWLVIAVLVTLQPTYGETRSRAWARIAGSTVGGLVAAVILHLAPEHWPLALLIGVSAAFAFGLAATHQAYWATFMTMCVLLLLDFQVQQTEVVAESRIVLTIIGGLIAVACTRLLWPRGETARLADRVARMMNSHAAAARVLAQLSRGRTAAERAEEAIVEAARDANAVTDSLTYVVHEPTRMMAAGRKSPTGKAPAGRTRAGRAPGGKEVSEDVEQVLGTAQHVRDDMFTLTSVLRDQTGGEGGVPYVLETLADRITEAADAVQARVPYAMTGEANRGLAEEAERLGALAERRLAEIAADENETPTRFALVHLAAVDHALRSLYADASQLCEAAPSAFEAG